MDKTLPKSERKRLEQLAKAWDEPPDLAFWERLTLPDLRLLLEHFEPLRALIRKVAAAEPHLLPRPHADAPAYAPVAPQDALAQAEAARCRDELEAMRQEAERWQRVAEQMQAQLTTLQAQHAQLQREHAALTQRLRAAEPTTAIVQGFRAEPALCQRLGLDLPASDMDALITLVAALSQRENIERLWEALRERCEAQGRAATAAERHWLETALGWFNRNWQRHPYRLVQPQAGEAFDHNRHRRCGRTPTGERVRQTWLPGISDSQGRPWCKPLVETEPAY